MDEMTAFERRPSVELDQMAGPGRRIDGMAMVRAISTQPPEWRFQTMFSATKFVIAGAVVALLGGFLLASMLSQAASRRLGASGTHERASQARLHARR